MCYVRVYKVYMCMCVCIIQAPCYLGFGHYTKMRCFKLNSFEKSLKLILILLIWKYVKLIMGPVAQSV